MTYTPGGKKSMEIVPEAAQILYLLNKNFKSAILNISKELKETTSNKRKHENCVSPNREY